MFAFSSFNPYMSGAKTDGSDKGDIIFGSFGSDIINGNGGNDLILGLFGHDTISGGEGRNFLFGNFGNDVIAGNTGDDFMFGGRGDDKLVWNNGDGSDLMNGGSGYDQVQVTLVDGLTQVGDDVELAFNNKVILFEDAMVSDFHTDDFMIA